MDNDKKHVIPRDRYRRRRRVFTEDGQEPIAPYEREPEAAESESPGDEASQPSQSASEARRASIGESRGRSHEPVYGYDDPTDEEVEDESGYQDVYTSPPAEEAGKASSDIPNEAHDVHAEDREADSGTPAGPQPEPEPTPRRARETPAAYNTAGAAYGYPGDEAPEAAEGGTEMKRTGRDENGRDRAVAGAAVPPDSRNADTADHGAVPPAGGDGSGNNGNDGPGRGRGGGGFFRSFLLPLLAGVLGALLVLLLFNAFEGGSDPELTATDEEEAGTEQETEEPAVEDATGNEITQAIDASRDSVVSVINLQRVDSLLPGIFGEMPETQQSEPEEAGIGSGVIYRDDGETAYIVTNHHVVEGAEELQVNMQNGESVTANIVGTDIWTDLAVLTISSEAVEGTLDFADSDELTVGQTAIAIGSPLGEAFSGSVSQGIVSGLDRSVPVDLAGDGSYDWEANVIQTDAAINPGNSGGALIDANGNLIGINSMKISMPQVEGIGFAIPANEVQKVVTQIEENGEVERPFLGVTLQDLYTIPPEIVQSEMNLPEDVNSGVVISSVQPGSPAEVAGLQQLDLVTALDGNAVDNMMELRQYLYYEKEPGDEMTIEYYRNGEQQTVTANLQ
ncbi:trypsin-like peptidase domain-containing protein [Lacicoccus alkaliphilus]|uniref:PDZ domain-containing protein n=1 Tax=Lacicoccus alkaliphilus DSM 16010 TaxID=1123231 RepID=A0A1M7G2Y9_9BACL|nr:trypsin-like peptidase domain-containing protein [Salinicoccus alkaliphilus]SHM10734.1 PDZ domain-containing protein [Salinicoccus alkaliphilus DSM 16010]